MKLYHDPFFDLPLRQQNLIMRCPIRKRKELIELILNNEIMLHANYSKADIITPIIDAKPEEKP